MKDRDYQDLEITKVQIDLSQRGNTLGTTNDYEYLSLCFEYQLSSKDGPFLVLKTEGWSVDDLDEFKEQMKEVCKNIYEMGNLEKALGEDKKEASVIKKISKIDVTKYPYGPITSVLRETAGWLNENYKNSKFDYFDYPDYAGLPDHLVKELVSDEVDWLQAQMQCLLIPHDTLDEEEPLF